MARVPGQQYLVREKGLADVDTAQASNETDAINHQRQEIDLTVQRGDTS